jgi:hypothetical protein
MSQSLSRVSIGLTLLLTLPAAAYAQASIAGTVRDASGAVLPGVSVEASSPALIEKTRSVVTDSTGQYKIVDLRPGTYAVTFSLSGFSTVRREGIELTGSFTAAVNADLKVGAIEESITVTGETPIVDVQSATKQRVLTSDVIAAIPVGRAYHVLTLLTPGVSTVQGNQDVGGTTGGLMTDMLVHGSKLDAQRIMENGLSLAVNIGFKAPAPPNMSAYQEVAVDIGAVDASTTTGGVRINLIPKEGGNTFSGTNFFSFANSAMQSNNFDQRLKDLRLASPDAVKRLWDIDPAFGGPIKKDTLWFFTSARQLGAYNYVGGVSYNANANNPNAWTYAPDTSRPAVRQEIFDDAQFRLTWQATPKNKLGFVYNHSDTNINAPFGCDCIRLNKGFAPEAATAFRFPHDRRMQANWTSPLTNRLLLEATVLSHTERWATDDVGFSLQPSGNTMISVTDQGGPIAGLTYRAPAQYGNQWMWLLLYRGSVSYITGAHSFKVGFNNGRATQDIGTAVHVPYSYRINSSLPGQLGVPVPNQLTLRAAPYVIHSRYNYDFGLYAQDRWTRDRLTLNYGIRLDAFGNTIPAQHLGPVALAPTRDISFPEQPNLAFRDLTPKLSAVYDVFGDGKTAVKVSLNKYMTGLIDVFRSLVIQPAAVNNVVAATARAWTDTNRNFIPDCDLLNPLANGECGRDANTAFGTLGPGAIYDPDLLTGWGHRNYNWELSTGIQHEIIPRVSADVSYYRRWYGNFQVTHDQNLTASDFDAFSITAPADPRLPNGGGQVISGLYDLNPAKFGQPARFYNTLSDKFGKQIEHFNGVDVTMNARIRNGLLLQGGTSTGRTVTDNCDLVAKLPDLLISGSTVTPQAYCHVQSPFLTQAKFLAAYTVPKIDVLVSGTFQSLPGPQVAAFVTVPSSVVKTSLGRDLSAGANQTVSVNPIRQSANLTPTSPTPTTVGTLFGERMNQLDFRVGKVLRLGRTRATANFDLYNATNANPVLTENNQYASFRQPFLILTARFAKVSLQWDF